MIKYNMINIYFILFFVFYLNKNNNIDIKLWFINFKFELENIFKLYWKNIYLKKENYNIIIFYIRNYLKKYIFLFLFYFENWNDF